MATQTRVESAGTMVPALGAERAVTWPKRTRVRLANGLEVLLAESHSIPKLHGQLSFRSGNAAAIDRGPTSREPRMDALIQPPSEPLLEPVKPKKRKWAERQRRKIAFLAADVATLEQLVGTLLGHLERATQPDFTDQERVSIRAMVSEIRGALAEDHSPTETIEMVRR